MVAIQNLPLDQGGAGIASNAGTAGTTTFDLSGAGAAPTADVTRFNQAMAADGPVATQSVTQASGSLPTIGARILEGFTSMSNNYATTMTQLTGAVGKDIGMPKLMRDLGDVMEMGHQVSLLSKTTGKATQTFNDLVK